MKPHIIFRVLPERMNLALRYCRKVLCLLFRRMFGCYLGHWFKPCKGCDIYDHGEPPPAPPPPSPPPPWPEESPATI